MKISEIEMDDKTHVIYITFKPNFIERLLKKTKRIRLSYNEIAFKFGGGYIYHIIN